MTTGTTRQVTLTLVTRLDHSESDFLMVLSNYKNTNHTGDILRWMSPFFKIKTKGKSSFTVIQQPFFSLF